MFILYDEGFVAFIACGLVVVWNRGGRGAT